MEYLPKQTQSEEKDCKNFAARLQPKYYFKFQKSLEHNQHGILSCIILYKLLLYFLESDFSVNEDYRFNKEEIRQFYIRREILRSIASHTCTDIYHLKIATFSFLLIASDDAQEWGRKGIENLYTDPKFKYNFGTMIFSCNEGANKSCKVTEYFNDVSPENYGSIKEIVAKQLRLYKEKKKIFRDGQDTINRDFNFEKETEITLDSGTKPIFKIIISIPLETRSSFKVIFSSTKFSDDKTKYAALLDQLFTSEKFRLNEIPNSQNEYSLIESL